MMDGPSEYWGFSDVSNESVGRKPGIKGDLTNLRDTWAGLTKVTLRGRSMKWFIFFYLVCLLLDALRHLEFTRFALAATLGMVVLVAEAFNTAIELICDKAWPRKNGGDPEVALIKHVAASAVMLVGFVVVPVELLLLIYPR